MSLEKVVLPGKRLGCKAKKIDSRTLKMAKYLASGLPPAPPSVDWTKSITVWGMMLNDQLGCCTIAGLGHAIQTWVSNASMPNADTLNVTDAEILKGYEDFDEYNPDEQERGRRVCRILATGIPGAIRPVATDNLWPAAGDDGKSHWRRTSTDFVIHEGVRRWPGNLVRKNYALGINAQSV
jgi:hypothetical protein